MAITVSWRARPRPPRRSGAYLAVVGALLLAAAGRRAAAALDVVQSWDAEHAELAAQIARARGMPPARRERLRAEALDPQALVQPGDTDPLDVVRRRTAALLAHLRRGGGVTADAHDACRRELEALATPEAGADRRARFRDACALRRRIALANPLLGDGAIIAMLEQPGDARIIEQARAVWGGHANGGGPVLVRNAGSRAECVPLLAGVPVSSGRWAGKELTGKFSGLELSFDGAELLFAATAGDEVWHLFRFNLASRRLDQLTDGPHDDFDPCQLPSGRIVFTSTRRGGVGRCVLTPQSLTYTLHSMEPDGTDIVCLSYHETNEWQPSVSHSGKLVYTRWDYVDRHWGSAHHFWECFPDGRDPRNYHGNYPMPYSAMPGDVPPAEYGQERLVYGRELRPDAELSFRAVPDAPTYTATAVGHHEGFSGSLVLLDPRIPDDGAMAQLKRITPEYPFPEVEPGGVHVYGTAWPLSGDFYLCNFNWGLYLLDRYGNGELLYDPGQGPHRVRDPIPLRPRPTPPVHPVQTWQGRRATLPDRRPATIAVMNVYTADEAARLPPGVRVKWMRIVQVIPQMMDNWFSAESVAQVSFATDSIGRMPLGIVPVEEDGSVYCEAPVGKALYFQLLDASGLAVHSMRSATYVHPGEQMTCLGCHEDKWRPDAPAGVPLAMRRAPSPLAPEVEGGAMPFNYIQLVKQPVFDRKCVDCHRKHPGAPDMSYRSLARHDRVFSYPGEGRALAMLGVGGSRTAPGRFGARVSGLWRSLATRPEHREVQLTDDERRRITLWLDLNSNEIGWIGNDRNVTLAQKRGEALWPPIDVDPAHPTGVEFR